MSTKYAVYVTAFLGYAAQRDAHDKELVPFKCIHHQIYLPVLSLLLTQTKKRQRTHLGKESRFGLAVRR